MTSIDHGLHVIFGAGQAGGLLARSLAGAGVRVRSVSRQGLADAPSGVEVRTGDATDPAFTREASRGAAVVYNLTNAPYGQWATVFPQLQAAILAGAAAAGARLVVLENLYMYGPTGGAPLTEATPLGASGPKGRVRAAMTEALFAAHARGDVRATSARAAELFGPGVVYGPMLPLTRAVLAGEPALVPGRLDAAHSFTYLPDLVQALVTLGASDAALGRAWHVPNPPAIGLGAFVEALGRAAGRPALPQALPAEALAHAAAHDPAARELVELAYMYYEPFVVDASAFTASFGLSATPLEAALSATVAWYRGPGAHVLEQLTD